MSNYTKDLVDKDIATSKAAIFHLIEHNEMLDDDGYPTDAALDVIRLWHWDDVKGWFKFIESIWSHGYGKWTVSESDTNSQLDNKKTNYYVSTGGWSGNEDIIRAMQNNKSMLWTLTWVQSRRGGHYIFERQKSHTKTLWDKR